MEKQNTWKACVYMVEDAEYKYWGLAAYGEGAETVYSRESQMKFVEPAFLGAGSLAAVMNENEMTPEEDGTTFGAKDLPRGRFLAEKEISALMKAEREAQQAAFQKSLLKNGCFKGRKF